MMMVSLALGKGRGTRVSCEPLFLNENVTHPGVAFTEN